MNSRGLPAAERQGACGNINGLTNEKILLTSRVAYVHTIHQTLPTGTFLPIKDLSSGHRGVPESRRQLYPTSSHPRGAAKRPAMAESKIKKDTKNIRILIAEDKN